MKGLVVVAKGEHERQQGATDESCELFAWEVCAAATAVVTVAGQLRQHVDCGHIEEGASAEEHGQPCTVWRREGFCATLQDNRTWY